MARNPQTGLADEELSLDPDLENTPEPLEEETTDDIDETEEAPEELEAEPAPLLTSGEDDERIPKSRFDAEKARADTLQYVLETLRQTQQPQRTAPAVTEDADANLTPEDRKWRTYIREGARPEIQRIVRDAVDDLRQNYLDPMRRTTLEVQDRTAENAVRSQFKDYDRYRDQINRQRADWFKQYNIVAPHDVAYHYVRSNALLKQSPATRTQAVRANAKQGATVSTKPPAKKVQPKGPISLDDVARMSPDDAERWLLRNNVKF